MKKYQKIVSTTIQGVGPALEIVSRKQTIAILPIDGDRLQEQRERGEALLSQVAFPLKRALDKSETAFSMVEDLGDHVPFKVVVEKLMDQYDWNEVDTKKAIQSTLTGSQRYLIKNRFGVLSLTPKGITHYRCVRLARASRQSA